MRVLEPVIGDPKDRASLDEACMGVKAVITTANSSKGSGDDNVELVDLQGNPDHIDAASGAGVEQFIFTSSMKAS